MADWPTVEAVKLSLGVTTSDRDQMLASAVAAAIEQVAVDCGYIEIDVEGDGADYPFTLSGTLDSDVDPEEVIPTASLSQAALILSVMTVKAPDAPFGIAAVFDTGGLTVAAQHPTYLRMLTGHRQAFGVG